MDGYTFVIAALLIGLFASMTADVILDMETIWNSQFERGSARIEKEDYPEKPRPNKIATLDWVQIVEDEKVVETIDVIALAKSRQKPKTVIQAGVKVRELLDGLSKSTQQLINYSAMNIRQLKALASQFKIKGYGKMKKAELIFALESMT